MSKTININIQGQVKQATPYVWTNGAWKETTAYVYHNQSWHITHQKDNTNIQFFSVINNLTHITSNNSLNSVQQNSSYIAVLTPDDGYEISTITILSGTTDITNESYNKNTNTITILEVADTITITAIATKVITYTNLLPTAKTTPTGSTILVGTNTTGYLTNKRISVTNGKDFRDGDYCTTGYIRAPYGATIRIKNVDIGTTNDGNVCIFVYNDAGDYLNTSGWDYLNNGKSGDTITVINNLSMSGITCFRLVAKTIDNTSIITVNEEIN